MLPMFKYFISESSKVNFNIHPSPNTYTHSYTSTCTHAYTHTRTHTLIDIHNIMYTHVTTCVPPIIGLVLNWS